MRVKQTDEQANFELRVNWGSKFSPADRRAIGRYFGVSPRTVERWFSPDPFLKTKWIPFLHPGVGGERREFAEVLLHGWDAGQGPGTRTFGERATNIISAYQYVDKLANGGATDFLAEFARSATIQHERDGTWSVIVKYDPYPTRRRKRRSG